MALTQVKTTGLADDAVTGAKIADDTVAEANMANDAISLTELKAGTDGQIITYDASGNPTAVGPGTDGQVLTSTGAGSPPAFEALPASNNYTHPNHSGEVTSTADGAQVIADNIVDEANLKVSNAPTNGHFLSAQSGNTGGLTWAAVPAGGITEYDRWNLTTTFTGDAFPITSNIARLTQDYNCAYPLGTGMTQSSGVFTFPSTGWWKVTFAGHVQSTNTNSSGSGYNNVFITATEDNGSNWSFTVEGHSGFHTGEFGQRTGFYASQVFDITDTSNDKVRFEFDTQNASHGKLVGSTAYNMTYFEFMKLADT